MPNKISKKLINIPLAGIELEGMLNIPDDARAIVIFVHGSGSSRLSPRENFVAGELNQAGFATLLFDLLTAEEDQTYANRFDLPLLKTRIEAVTAWIKKQKETGELPIGYFGGSTGATAALLAAADLGEEIKAVVSRGGRPDLAIDFLDLVKAPTLLIVGGNDFGVIELNEQAYAKLKTTKELSIVPGATHLFEEPGKLEEVARRDTAWFKKYLAVEPASRLAQ